MKRSLVVEDLLKDVFCIVAQFASCKFPVLNLYRRFANRFRCFVFFSFCTQSTIAERFPERAVSVKTAASCQHEAEPDKRFCVFREAHLGVNGA